MKTTLAERLALAMEAGQFNQATLAEAAGVSQPTVWKILSGRTQSSAKIVDLARALRVRPEWLADGSGKMRQDSEVIDGHDAVLYEGTHTLKLYNENDQPIGFVIVPDAVNPESSTAYKLSYDTGFAELPQGSTIVVDANEPPTSNDFVYARVNGKSSAYRYVSRGPQNYLDVGDSRLPLVPVDEGVELLGVIVFMTRSFRR